MTDTERVISTFLEIVQIDSPTGHESAMAQYVSDRLGQIGVSCEIDREGNVIAKTPGDTSKETYLLNAHLDTVEPGRGIVPLIDEAGWIRSSGPTILGADNKTAVAAILSAVERLASNNFQNNHPLEIVFTVSEESGNHGAHGLDYSRISAKQGYIFDASGREFGDMIISSPFYNRFDAKISGRPAHASRPQDAVNVVPILGQALKGVQLGRLTEKTILNVGTIRVGDVVNTIPGEALVSGEIRSRDEEELETYSGQLVTLFERASHESGAKAEIRITRENSGFQFDPKGDFISHTISMLKLFGITPHLIDSWGCYEANIFAEHGILMLNIADGSLDGHTPDERIHMNDLVRLADVVYALVTER